MTIQVQRVDFDNSVFEKSDAQLLLILRNSTLKKH